MTTLRELLADPGRSVTLAEIVTTRGLADDTPSKRVAELAFALAEDPRFDALSITDNAGGNANISPDVLGAQLRDRGQEVIIHQSCKDWNRNGLQSRLWQLASQGFQNILVFNIQFCCYCHRFPPNV